MIDWKRACTQLDYNFDSIGATSIISYLDDNFGKLSFHWEANKKKIRLSFIDTCPICICGSPDDIIECDCEWYAFQEGPAYPSKIFTKQEFQKLTLPTLF